MDESTASVDPQLVKKIQYITFLRGVRIVTVHHYTNNKRVVKVV